jgi:hypothetical protein
MVNASRTKRTFIGADARFKRVGWQSCVAVFASWPEFQHGLSFPRSDSQPLVGYSGLCGSMRAKSGASVSCNL